VNGKLLLRIAGAVSLLFGLIGLLAPETTASFLNLGLSARFATGEIRAVYGGLFLVTGLTPLMGAGSAHGRGMIRGVGLAWAGMAAGRIVSLVLDGPADLLSWIALVVEAGIVFCLFAGTRQVGAEAKKQEA